MHPAHPLSCRTPPTTNVLMAHTKQKFAVHEQAALPVSRTATPLFNMMNQAKNTRTFKRYSAIPLRDLNPETIQAVTATVNGYHHCARFAFGNNVFKSRHFEVGTLCGELQFNGLSTYVDNKNEPWQPEHRSSHKMCTVKAQFVMPDTIKDEDDAMCAKVANQEIKALVALHNALHDCPQYEEERQQENQHNQFIPIVIDNEGTFHLNMKIPTQDQDVVVRDQNDPSVILHHSLRKFMGFLVDEDEQIVLVKGSPVPRYEPITLEELSAMEGARIIIQMHLSSGRQPNQNVKYWGSKWYIDQITVIQDPKDVVETISTEFIPSGLLAKYGMPSTQPAAAPAPQPQNSNTSAGTPATGETSEGTSATHDGSGLKRALDETSPVAAPDPAAAASDDTSSAPIAAEASDNKLKSKKGKRQKTQ